MLSYYKSFDYHVKGYLKSFQQQSGTAKLGKYNERRTSSTIALEGIFKLLSPRLFRFLITQAKEFWIMRKLSTDFQTYQASLRYLRLTLNLPFFLMPENILDSIRQALLQAAIPPTLPKDLITPRDVPIRGFYSVGVDLRWFTLSHSFPEFWEVVVNDVGHELRRDESRHKENTFVRSTGSSHGKNVRFSDVSDVHLIKNCCQRQISSQEEA